jgi:hypothetical protein
MLFVLMLCTALPTWHAVLLPAFVVLAGWQVGPALLITALNVKYRDFRYYSFISVRPYVSRLVSSAVVPPDLRFWYSLNPMVGVIDGFAGVCSAASGLYLPGFLLSLGVVACFSGLASSISAAPNAHCGFDLMSTDVVIRGENVGKIRDRASGPDRGYVALRDVVTRGISGTWRKTADILRGRAAVSAIQPKNSGRSRTSI